METTLAVEARDPDGKGSARKLRSSTGKIPGVIYGPSLEPVAVAVDPAALNKIFKTTRNRNTVVQLELNGKTFPALVKEVQKHPVKRDLVHVDFYAVTADRKVDVMVPVTTVGKPAGAIMGGRLRIIRRELRARCDFDKIPENFVIDVSHMDIKDMFKASEIKAPEGVEVVYDNDYNVVTVYGRRVTKAAT